MALSCHCGAEVTGRHRRDCGYYEPPRTPPGQIIDGDAEEQLAAESLARVFELQGISTLMLVGRAIVRAETMGIETVFAVEFDDGSKMSFKMLSYDPPPGSRISSALESGD